MNEAIVRLLFELLRKAPELVFLMPQIIKIVQEILTVWHGPIVQHLIEKAGLPREDAAAKVGGWATDPLSFDPAQEKAWMDRASREANG